jgi:hypothetical protein
VKRACKDPVHRAEVLKRERALAPTLFAVSEDERREIARKLGLEHHLPDPQQTLPLPGATR